MIIEVCFEVKQVPWDAVMLGNKKAWILNLCHQGTGIPCNDKRAHARVVSILAYHLVA